jgi:uncharacterized protein (TIGR00369 family)
MSEQSRALARSENGQTSREIPVQQAAAKSSWTGDISTTGVIRIDVVLQQLCRAFNTSPFFHHLNMKMILEDQDIKCIVDMDNSLIGNVAFQILHGGVAATLLDSIGGIVAMGELYKRADKDHIAETVKKVTRLATVDMRVDYIAPGRGKQFIGSAEVLRMGRKGCTTRMDMHNEEGKLIATGIASYAY